MPKLDEKNIYNVLTDVRLPDNGGDVVSAGRIAGLTMKDGAVHLSISTTPDEAPVMDEVRQNCERAIAALPGVQSVSAVLTEEKEAPELSPTTVPDSGTADSKLNADGVGAIVAVASGKGGVGKSTTAVNLALALARAGKQVGIMDADIYGPSVPRMMGIDGQPASAGGNRLFPKESYGVKCMSMGLLVQEEEPMIWRGPMVHSALEQMLNDVVWAPLDILIVDMPPGTGDAQMTLAQETQLAGAVIVSTPQDIALLDARKGINMFREVAVPILGIIENMSHFICPHCDERSNIFDTGGARRTAENYGTEFLGEIPLDMAIRETSDSGRPIVVSKANSPHAQAYMEIAGKLVNNLEQSAGAKAGP